MLLCVLCPSLRSEVAPCCFVGFAGRRSFVPVLKNLAVGYGIYLKAFLAPLGRSREDYFVVKSMVLKIRYPDLGWSINYSNFAIVLRICHCVWEIILSVIGAFLNFGYHISI